MSNPTISKSVYSINSLPFSLPVIKSIHRKESWNMAVIQSNPRILMVTPEVTYLPDNMGNGFLFGLVTVLIFDNYPKL